MLSVLLTGWILTFAIFPIAASLILRRLGYS